MSPRLFSCSSGAAKVGTCGQGWIWVRAQGCRARGSGVERCPVNASSRRSMPAAMAAADSSPGAHQRHILSIVAPIIQPAHTCYQQFQPRPIWCKPARQAGGPPARAPAAPAPPLHPPEGRPPPAHEVSLAVGVVPWGPADGIHQLVPQPRDIHGSAELVRGGGGARAGGQRPWLRRR